MAVVMAVVMSVGFAHAALAAVLMAVTTAWAAAVSAGLSCGSGGAVLFVVGVDGPLARGAAAAMAAVATLSAVGFGCFPASSAALLIAARADWVAVGALLIAPV